MVTEIRLPIKSETCDKILDVLLHVLLISGLPALGFGIYFLVTSNDLFHAVLAVVLSLYGLIFSLVSFTVYADIISDFYDEHKIVFKCSCEQPKTEQVK